MLRGCIGYIDPPWKLRGTIVNASIASATEDPRFTPVKERELDNITVEVTILDHPEQIRVAGKQDFGNLFNSSSSKNVTCESIDFAAIFLPAFRV